MSPPQSLSPVPDSILDSWSADPAGAWLVCRFINEYWIVTETSAAERVPGNAAALENFDIANKAVINRWPLAIDYHPSGKLLAATHADGAIYVWTF